MRVDFRITIKKKKKERNCNNGWLKRLENVLMQVHSSIEGRLIDEKLKQHSFSLQYIYKSWIVIFVFLVFFYLAQYILKGNVQFMLKKSALNFYIIIEIRANIPKSLTSFWKSAAGLQAQFGRKMAISYEGKHIRRLPKSLINKVLLLW